MRMMRTFAIIALTIALATSSRPITFQEKAPTPTAITSTPAAMSSTAIDLELVGAWPYGSCNTVTADGNYVYIGSGGVIIIADMVDPSNPVVVSRIATPSAVWKLVRSGDHLYVADKMGGLRIIDVSVPSDPVEVGSFGKRHHMGVGDVYVFDSYAYVATEALYILDISDPSAPVELNSLYDSDWVWDIDVAGSYAYLTTADGGLRVLDIGDPANPVEVSSGFDLGYEARVDATEGFVYLADSHDGLYILDVSDPGNPVEVAHLYYGAWVWDLQVSDSYAYVATFFDLRILDVSDPGNPLEISSYTYDRDHSSDWEDLYVYGGYAYVTWSYGGLRIIDVSEPSNPVKAGFFATSGSAFDVFVSGDYVYVANNDFYILNSSDPSNPVEVSNVNTYDSDASSVYVTGGYAYVSGHTGLRIFDVSDPANPLEVSSILSIQGDIRYQGIHVAGDYAYWLRYARGLRILDVGDPSNPVEVGSFNTPDDWETRAVYVSSDYAYVTYGSDDHEQFRGLRIIDVSNPSNPVEVGSFATPENANGVYISSGHAYLTTSDKLRIVDVGDPSNLVELSVYPIPGGGGLDVYVSDGNAYVVAGPSGFCIVDVSDPSNPMEVNRTTDLWWPCGLYVSGDHVYVADMDYGLVIFRKESTYRFYLPLILRSE